MMTTVHVAANSADTSVAVFASDVFVCLALVRIVRVFKAKTSA